MPFNLSSVHNLTTSLFTALGAWNAVVFLMMGYDKLQARRGGWRISERTLLTCAALFGAAGMWLAMRLFHHKTQHSRFRYGAPTFLAVQVALLIWLFVRLPR